ncbi:MAG: threonine/serine exporter family protein [Lachnospiraceae bacterium]|nr:threonine/serine exporter family protein [Lachnospiraceae bacterium]
MILKIIGVFIAIVAYSVIIETPRRFLWLSGLVSAVGGAVFVVCNEAWRMDMVLASFWSALGIALLSHIFARAFRAPVTLFLVAGILPTVPGAGMYRTVYYLILGDASMSSFYLTQTLEVAGVIALAIFLMDSVSRIFLKRDVGTQPWTKERNMDKKQEEK